MTPLPSATCAQDDEEKMKEWAERFKPVHQRTVRQETTMDKAGTLPIALYQNEERGLRGDLVEIELEENDVNNQPNDIQDGHYDSDTYVSEDEDENDDIQDGHYDSDTDVSEDDDQNDDTDVQNDAVLPVQYTRSGRSIKVIVRMDL